MSRYSYAGNFKNPADNYFVKEVGDHFEVWVRSDRRANGSAPADRKARFRGRNRFDEHEDAADYIASIGEFFENDYSDYLEENRYELAQMERYEAFRNEQ